MILITSYRIQVWIANGDIVLVSLRDYQDDKGDIIHKYYTGEAVHLIRVGEIPDSGEVHGKYQNK